jgi:hypothetical protein
MVGIIVRVDGRWGMRSGISDVRGWTSRERLFERIWFEVEI